MVSLLNGTFLTPKEKVALTEEEEQALLSFIKTDNVYHKYYDEVLILLKTGLRISELCGLTMADIDFKNEVVVVSHQLLKRCDMWQGLVLVVLVIFLYHTDK
mgnify:CR=1 FL=1